MLYNLYSTRHQRPLRALLLRFWSDRHLLLLLYRRGNWEAMLMCILGTFIEVPRPAAATPMVVLILRRGCRLLVKCGHRCCRHGMLGPAREPQQRHRGHLRLPRHCMHADTIQMCKCCMPDSKDCSTHAWTRPIQIPPNGLTG